MASQRTSTRRGRSRTSEQNLTLTGRLQSLFRDTASEIRKVTWPDSDTTRNLTIFVVALSIFLGALLGGVDAIFVRVWENIPTF
ncbi:MAG: preprotein translocase subunit SecE [Thermomicrobiales bacterium]